MPNGSLNVYLTAVDGMSPVLASITDKTKALDKESQELQQTYEALQMANKGLIAQKTELQKRLQEVNEEVKAARKQFRELGDEASTDAFNKAVEKQQALKNEIAGTTKALQENQKIYRENIEIARKNALGGESSGSDLRAIWSGLGIGKEVSSLVGQAGGTLLSSALGGDMGSMASNALSSVITGASLGTAINPGLGTAIGAALGGLSGLASGAIEQWGSRDDAFKEYYGGLYEDVKGRSGEMVEAGSAIAGGREQTKMAFSRRLGGDKQAEDYLAEVEKMAAKTNYGYDEIVGYTKLLLNSYKAETKEDADGRKETDVLDVLMALSDATAGLDLSSSDVNMMISGLSRMRTTGKATQEYLNYFRERGVDVDEALADALGVEKSSIADKVKEGEIGGEAAAQAILDFIQKEFGGLSEGLAGTYDAMVDNLGDMEASIQAKGGDAYNELRKSGITAQQEAYEGDFGEALKEINAVLGENQARKENLQEQYMREVQAAVFEGKHGELWDKLSEEQQGDLTDMAQKFAEAKERYDASERTDWEAGAELEKLYEATLAAGQSYFDNSDEIAMLNDKEVEEIVLIRENSAGLLEATQNIYRQTQELSRGRASVMLTDGKTLIPDQPYASRKDYAQRNRAGLPSSGGLASPRQTYQRRSHAFGLERVPYDDYPALLHRDERVLTASEARAQDGGAGAQPIQLTVTGNSFMGVGEDLADQLWEIIARKLEQAAVAAAPK